MDCQICMETFDDEKIYTVLCGSPVGHNICFDCEGTWRSKMPLQDGTRTMTCPTCRTPEVDRTKESLLRELKRVNNRLVMANEQNIRLHMLERVLERVQEINVSQARTQSFLRPTRPRSLKCSSGRVCPITSRTHLKCRVCTLVPCCRACHTCVTCA